MFTPPQGFRHAATLLVTSSLRSIPPDAPPDAVAEALTRLAANLVELAEDMRASPASAEWLTFEYSRRLEELPHAFDRAAARKAGADILARVPVRRAEAGTRDLFLVFVPEDRLPVAAPLAIDLLKRRVSVALSEYEVTSRRELDAALRHGLERHLGGVVLRTSAFDRVLPDAGVAEAEGVRVVQNPSGPPAAAGLAAWAAALRVRNIARKPGTPL